MADVDLCLNRPSTFTLTELERLLVVIVEVDIGPVPYTIPSITPVIMVYC